MPGENPTNSNVFGTRWMAFVLLLGVVALLVLVAANLRGRNLELPPLVPEVAANGVFPVKKIQQLSANAEKTSARLFSPGNHPFFTDYFKPPPAPPVVEPVPVVTEPPPPPPPEMKKVQLVFQGVYESADNRQQAFLLIENKLTILPLGAKAIEEWSIAEIGRQKLTLTNAAAQTNILEFNRPRELEFPVK